MTPREVEEYRALRATVRERGTARVWLFFGVMVAWAAATIATAAPAALPVATLLPLLVLAAGFEALFSLHTGVERIGRYIQVFYADEEGDPPASLSGGRREWERTVMVYGLAHPGSGSDPLFAAYFFLAAILNFVPVLLAEPVRIEVIVVGAAHLIFIGRVIAARRASGRQRAVDLERFERLKREIPA